MRFAFDINKAISNELKHGVSFAEAQTIFADRFFVIEYRINSPKTELRFRATGISELGNYVSVVYTQRTNTIRIISAHLTNKKGRELYENRKSLTTL
jgi:uncharacterized protein